MPSNSDLRHLARDREPPREWGSEELELEWSSGSGSDWGDEGRVVPNGEAVEKFEARGETVLGA